MGSSLKDEAAADVGEGMVGRGRGQSPWGLEDQEEGLGLGLSWWLMGSRCSLGSDHIFAVHLLRRDLHRH